MNISANFSEAYKLLHDGSQALYRMSYNGIRVDIDFCKKKKVELLDKLANLEDNILKTETGKSWRLQYGSSLSLMSNEQLNFILFTSMGIQRPDLSLGIDEQTEEDESVDKKILEILSADGLDAAKYLLQYRKYYKACYTYINNLLIESIDGILHPGFPLNRVVTYRSSSEGPNFQNMPIRDPEIGAIVRGALRARKGHMLVEFDFKAIEVGVGVCYHKDPRMHTYVSDKNTDMHRDMAMQCSIISDPKQVHKNIRYCAKNKFVFPEFYGDWWVSCAKALWNAMDEMKLTLNDGTPLRKHLASKGIKELGTLSKNEKGFFEASPTKCFFNHIKEVEKDFWNNRFKVYKEWKNDWYQSYLEKGYFDMYTGFRCSGIMSKKNVVNYPVQGSAFHCNLKTLIMADQWLQNNPSIDSFMCGQIHDSGLWDINPKELDFIIDKVNSLVTKRLPKVYPWINVPLQVEVEACKIDEPWISKKPLEIN